MNIYLLMKIRWNLNQIHKLSYFSLSYFLFLSFFLFLSGRFPKFYYLINLLSFLKIMLSCFKFHDLFFFFWLLECSFSQCIINCSLSLGLLRFSQAFFPLQNLCFLQVLSFCLLDLSYSCYMVFSAVWESG